MRSMDMADMRMLRVLGGFVALLAASLAGTFLLDLKPQKKMVLFRIQIFLLFFLVMCLVTRFVWVRLMILLPFRRTSSKVLFLVHWLSYGVFVTFVALAFFSIPIGRFFVGVEPYFITKMAFTCLGLLILLFFNLCVLSVIFFILRFCKIFVSDADFWKSFLAIGISVILCIHGFIVASEGPYITRVTIPISKLPKSLDRTTILHLSDLHIGPMVGLSGVSRVVAMISEIHPDIVVITGDLVDSTVQKLKQSIFPLKKLRSKYGTFFVTGNHEYYTGDVDAWLEQLKELGIQPLHNSYALISSGKNHQDKIYLAGVDDIEASRLGYEGHGMNLSRALHGLRFKYPTILLAHQPNAVQQVLNQFAGFDLILCGHTHGGQFFPMHLPIYLFNPFFAGLYKHKGTHIFVSSGTYFYSVPLRIFSQPEIAILTLVG